MEVPGTRRKSSCVQASHWKHLWWAATVSHLRVTVSDKVQVLAATFWKELLSAPRDWCRVIRLTDETDLSLSVSSTRAV